jgi:hypothetical protein
MGAADGSTEGVGGDGAVNEAFIMNAQLPESAWFFQARVNGIYPIQRRQARHSTTEIRG